MEGRKDGKRRRRRRRKEILLWEQPGCGSTARRSGATLNCSRWRERKENKKRTGKELNLRRLNLKLVKKVQINRVGQDRERGQKQQTLNGLIFAQM